MTSKPARPRRHRRPQPWTWSIGAILEHATDPLPGTACRLWTGGVNSNGYGCIRVGGRSVFVHRVVVAWTYGVTLDDLPDRLQSRHLCPLPVPNRRCVNPDHLGVGSAAMNSADRFREPAHRVAVRW